MKEHNKKIRKYIEKPQQKKNGVAFPSFLICFLHCSFICPSCFLYFPDFPHIFHIFLAVYYIGFPVSDEDDGDDDDVGDDDVGDCDVHVNRYCRPLHRASQSDLKTRRE